MRRDTKAIEAAVMAWAKGITPGITASKIYTYLAHLAEHGDDEGCKWKLVPAEPTEGMIENTHDSLPDEARLVWAEMLDAAPSVTGEKE